MDKKAKEHGTSKADWSPMTHREHVEALSRYTVEQLANDYYIDGFSDTDFSRHLAAQKELWDVHNVKKLQSAGRPPTKDVVLGAWRDLDRSEALLELIDNSIDAWLRRMANYPRKTAPELDIYIDVDSDSGRLVYEDNAGGVPVEKLTNLVIPGHSDTTELTRTIGSYKTGGKKAIFKLANQAQITTRYWNPAGSTDDAVAVHLDETWINDAELYEFSYAELQDVSVVEQGQTRYMLDLRAEPVGEPWYNSPDDIDQITKDIRRTYTLLMARNPKIHIYFNDRTTPLNLDKALYIFSGHNDSKVDIRPQRVTFDVPLDFQGTEYSVSVEIVLGCRTTTGVREGLSWGIDLYGNDRLFVAYDQETFEDWLPKGNARQMIRGYVNICGPNIFIPWDTHKRHLNAERDIMRVLTKHKLIRELFENWDRAYKDISSAGKGEVTRLIRTPLEKQFDGRKKDLYVPHEDEVKLTPKMRRTVTLPDHVFKPKVKVPKKKKNNTVKVNFNLSLEDARRVTAYFGLEGELASLDLSTAIKEDVLNRAGRRTVKRRSNKRP